MMNSRFQRGKVGGISAFFAFQDIITSAMAVVITIVMLLALDMGDPSTASPGEPDPGNLTARLDQLLTELSEATANLRSLQLANEPDTLDPKLLQAEVDTLKAELGGIRAQSVTREKTLTGMQGNVGTRIVEAELDSQKGALAAAAKQLAAGEEEAAGSLEQMKQAERALRAKEASLLAEQAKGNELWLIPETSKTSKEPILAVVSSDSVTLQRFDQPEKREVPQRNLESSFKEALRTYSKLDQYIVFYFKPSGVVMFERLTTLAKQAGFEIGYDAVAEETAINFSRAP